MGDIKNTIIYYYIITVVQKGAFQSLAKNPAQEDFSTIIKEKVLRNNADSLDGVD